MRVESYSPVWVTQPTVNTASAERPKTPLKPEPTLRQPPTELVESDAPRRWQRRSIVLIGTATVTTLVGACFSLAPIPYLGPLLLIAAAAMLVAAGGIWLYSLTLPERVPQKVDAMATQADQIERQARLDYKRSIGTPSAPAPVPPRPACRS